MSRIAGNRITCATAYPLLEKAAVIVRSYPFPLSQAPPLSFLSATYLQHVKQRGLSGIVEAQEEQLGVLVEQAQGGQHIVD